VLPITHITTKSIIIISRVLKWYHTIIQSTFKMLKIFLFGIKMTIVRKITVKQIYAIQQMNTNTLWMTFVLVSPTLINITNSNIAHFITPFIMTRVNNASHYT
jgi:hypothetical protein